MEASNSKSQAPNSKEIPNPKFEIRNRGEGAGRDLRAALAVAGARSASPSCLGFEFGFLVLGISLEFGAWDLVFAQTVLKTT
jgi:hypothetical protein